MLRSVNSAAGVVVNDSFAFGVTGCGDGFGFFLTAFAGADFHALFGAGRIFFDFLFAVIMFVTAGGKAQRNQHGE